jgi:hypothetical protein
VSFNLKNMILYISTFCVNFADDPKWWNYEFLGYHGPRPCYIKKFVYEEGAERRFVVHDTECTTNTIIPDPKILRFKHIVGIYIIKIKYELNFSQISFLLMCSAQFA